MKVRRMGLLALFFSALLLTGCWDVHDISDRTPIIAMGFDYLPGGRWRVSISDVVLAQGGAATYSEAIHWGEGATLTGAVEDLRTHLSRRLYLGSCKLYVLGIGALQAHSTEVLRMLLERSEVDTTGFVLGTRATAQALLAKPDGVMGVTGVRLLKEFESEMESRDGHIKEPIWKTVWGTLDTGDTLRLPMFDQLAATSVKASGTALISGGRLRVLLDREESVDLRWLMNVRGRNVLALDPPYSQYDLKTTSTHATTTYDGRTRHISVRLSAALEMYTAPSLVLPERLLQQLAQAAAQTMARRMVALTRKMQQADVDGALWHNAAMRAGHFDFDIRRTSISVQVRARVAPQFSPSL